MNHRTLLLLSLSSITAWGGVPEVIVRHEFENATWPVAGSGVILNGGGNIHNGFGSAAPSGGGMQLRESVVGLPSSGFLSPHDEFANQVLLTTGLNGAPAVYLQLYPLGYKNGGVAGSRSQIQSGNSAFRYKWLMYGQDPGGTPAIINLFEQTFSETDDADNPWFNDNDRANARNQIAVLREALAYSPLDGQLQGALLDVYYDLSVAEMQFVRKRQAKLATLRLGLTLDPAKPFIIDQEIETYTRLVEITDGILGDYGDLLSLEMAGFDPGDVDPSAGGAPFGYWLFQQRVPSRSQVETDLGSAPGPGLVRATNRVATFTIPGDDNDFTITAPGTLPGEPAEDASSFFVELTEGAATPGYDAPTRTLRVPVQTDISRVNDLITRFGLAQGLPAFVIASAPGDDGTGIVSATLPLDPVNTGEEGSTPVFDGFKDFRTLLTILGQNIQFRAELAELLGKRRANGDLTEARSLLSDAQGPLASDFDALRRMFADVDFDLPAYDGTGVRGAFTLVGNAINQTVRVRGFLNGTTNMLGLDPEFLILLKPASSPGNFDTYDILIDELLRKNSGTAVGPLAIAVDALENPNPQKGAIAAYNIFRASVDEVGQELSSLETGFALRLEAITGYTTADRASDPGLLPELPDPWDGSFNPAVSSELKTLGLSINSLKNQQVTLGQITLQLLDDVKNANEAVALADSIDDTITGAEADYLDAVSSAWTEIHVWAGLAAGAQAAADTTFAVTGADNFVGGAVAAAAGAVNTGVQTAAATRTSMREQEKEEAELGFQTKLALAEVPLTVKQAQLDLGALMREAYQNRFDIEANFGTLAQAVADKAGLIREVQQLTADLDADRSELGSRYFADPIHYLRAEGALLKADAEFRRAQRWVFYTARALEYKWQQRFSYADAGIGESYDIGRILSARNATELGTIVTKMEQFDGDLTLNAGTPVDDRVIVSLRDHILTPNPDDRNLSFPPALVDDGRRFDPVLNRMVSKTERFRSILAALVAESPTGQLSIEFDTTRLAGLGGQFFAGPNYVDDRVNPATGLFRDKIDWIAVNVVASGGPTVNRSASLRYGGTTYFRTRVAPCWTRAPGDVTESGADPFSNDKDFPGEFIIAPFRYYQDTNLTGLFDTFPELIMPSLKVAYSLDSATEPAVLNRIIADTPGAGSAGFRRTDFKELSVAATRWRLQFSSGQLDLDLVEDIELIIQHKAYTRPQITCPAN